MGSDEILKASRDEILRIARRHGAESIRVFGSVARGDAGPESDVDFLVATGSSTSPWFPAGLVLDLEALLGRRVDVVTERALRSDLRERVLREAIAL